MGDMEHTARAAPDVYTLYQGNVGTLTVNPNVYKVLKVKPPQDFTAIKMMAMPEVKNHRALGESREGRRHNGRLNTRRVRRMQWSCRPAPAIRCSRERFFRLRHKSFVGSEWNSEFSGSTKISAALLTCINERHGKLEFLLCTC